VNTHYYVIVKKLSDFKINDLSSKKLAMSVCIELPITAGKMRRQDTSRCRSTDGKQIEMLRITIEDALSLGRIARDCHPRRTMSRGRPPNREMEFMWSRSRI